MLFEMWIRKLLNLLLVVGLGWNSVAADGKRFQLPYSIFFLLNYSLLGVIPRSLHSAFQSSIGHIRPQSSAQVQNAAVENLIVRVLGKDSSLFKLTVDPTITPQGKDTFKVRK